MAKTKTPFLSLGSQGSIGGVITTQQGPGLTIIRTKPRPTYRNTLPQQYQRWLYQDYAYWWKLQTEAWKRIYSADGTRFHLTGFQYWMKYCLANLPYHAGIWRLDERLGTIATDTSRNSNNGTIYGASPAQGIIDGAQAFDGINDRIACGTDPSLIDLSTWCLELYFFHTDLSLDRGLWRFRDTAQMGLSTRTNQRLQFYCYAELTGFDYLNGTTALTPLNTWHYASINWSDALAELYVNDILQDTIINPGRLLNFDYFDLGRGGSTTRPNAYHLGRIDHAILYNINLDSEIRQRHALRRYQL